MILIVHIFMNVNRLCLNEGRTEAESNLGPSAYRPNALLLGQTGFRGKCTRK